MSLMMWHGLEYCHRFRLIMESALGKRKNSFKLGAVQQVARRIVERSIGYDPCNESPQKVQIKKTGSKCTEIKG